MPTYKVGLEDVPLRLSKLAEIILRSNNHMIKVSYDVRWWHEKEVTETVKLLNVRADDSATIIGVYSNHFQRDIDIWHDELITIEWEGSINK